MGEFLERYGKIIEIGWVHGFFTLAAFSSLWSGLLSVAPVPIAAVAGFSGALMTNDLGLDINVVILLGAVIGGVAAWILSYPLLRLSSHWVALATVALLLVSRVVILNFNDATGGANGTPWPRMITTYHSVMLLVLAMWYFARIRRSRLGLSIEAVRSDADVAASLGIGIAATRRIAFVQSGVLAGVGGILFGNIIQFIGPETYYVNLTFLMLAAVVLGGRFHWLGAIVGALVFTAIPEIMRFFLDTGEQIANGFILIVIIIYLPGGLIEPGRRQRRLGARIAQAEAEKAFEAESDTTLDAVEQATAERLQAQVGRTVVERDVDAAPSGLRIEHVTKRFGGLIAVDDMTLDIPQNSIFGILGPNGAGKTTLLNLISGLETVDEGNVLLGDRNITNLPAHGRARVRIARTFQNVRLFEGLTVLENIIVGQHAHRVTHAWEAALMLPRERKERRVAEEKARELMDRVGVIGQPDQYAGTLSYANQRRAEIARALAAEPDVLLLDEPTAGMHKLGTAAVGELLLELQERGLTMVVIEHNMQLVLDYCERAAVMDSGKLLCRGLPSECLNRPEVREAYFGRRADADRLESLIQLRKH